MKYKASECQPQIRCVDDKPVSDRLYREPTAAEMKSSFVELLKVNFADTAKFLIVVLMFWVVFSLLIEAAFSGVM